ncbi:lipoyl synthase [Bacteroides sp. 51]|uniref:lipoyl synthase n=1 Tax=Bacteroides sp. 51 TaxID=2302938 RepID=UPI0013D80CFB|nr:lipoyl synthase [Bacteroides sp. 51]NDV81235.1 lipoyl synthase [Bacteroides sp. 51]
MKERIRKPEWLKISIGANERYTETKRIVESNCLHTICNSGRCPNMGECWGKGTATFMIGGNICTRSCKFCNTQTGKPLPLEPEEPKRVAESIRLMKLTHAVITSVDRDDLPDLGAQHWANTIRAIKSLNPETTIEVLIPDFQGKPELVDLVIEARPDIISHNMETVKRISPLVRSAARYDTSLNVIKQIAASGTTAKSGIMVGLSETTHEVEELMDDLIRAGCHILTIGQYLQPSHKHYAVREYVTPQQFEEYKETGLNKGFQQVESGPLVRSSYHAEKHIKKA